MVWMQKLQGLAALTALATTFLACDADESGPNVVDITVHDDSISIPASLEPGYTTFLIDGQSEGDNHLLFVRANDGVSRDSMEAGIRANDFRTIALAIIGHDLQIRGVLDHVVIGDDVAVIGDDEAGTEGGARIDAAGRASGTLVAEEAAAHIVVDPNNFQSGLSEMTSRFRAN